MADAWSTVVAREPEYDELGQSEILALMAWESRCCPSCSNYDSFVPQGEAPQDVRTPDGRTFTVQLHRCLACGLEEMVRREWNDSQKHAPSYPGAALASDGLIFIARPKKEDTDA